MGIFGKCGQCKDCRRDFSNRISAWRATLVVRKQFLRKQASERKNANMVSTG